MQVYTIQEAEAEFDALFSRAKAGEPIFIGHEEGHLVTMIRAEDEPPTLHAAEFADLRHQLAVKLTARR